MGLRASGKGAALCGLGVRVRDDGALSRDSAHGTALTGVAARVSDEILVDGSLSLNELISHLLSPGRMDPVVGLAASRETGQPALSPSDVRLIVGPHARIYFLPSTVMLTRLELALGRRLALTEGTVRVWWPRPSRDSGRGDHPIVEALIDVGKAEMLAEFSRVFDLSRPYVRKHILQAEELRRFAQDGEATARRELGEARAQLEAVVREREKHASRAHEAETRANALARELAERRRDQAPK